MRLKWYNNSMEKQIRNSGYIVGVGAANVDINGRSYAPVNYQDSNPGYMHVSVGGVTRNILENYCRLGGNAVLLSVAGDDIYGRKILSESKKAGIDVSHVMTVSGCASSTYMSILDSDGSLALSLSDMNIMKHLSVDYLRKNEDILRNASLIVTDPSVGTEVISYLLDNYDNVCLDPVSVAYAETVKDYIGCFMICKPNALECGMLSDREITDGESVEKAAEVLINRGLKEIYVSLGKDGCLYLDRDGNKMYSHLLPLEEVVNATGAGDAFMAMILYAKMNQFTVEKALEYACGAGMAAVMSEDTINRNISLELIEKILKERRV